jgi:hypothetical protein
MAAAGDTAPIPRPAGQIFSINMARNAKRRTKSRKPLKQTASGTKDKQRKETGIDKAMAHFFLGGQSKIAGELFYKPPRWTEEYKKMRVVDLVRRIQGDLEELQAPAYERRLRVVIHKNISDSLRPEEPRHAANALVFLTQGATTYLENLFFKRQALMKEIARTRDLWPVNLGRRLKTVTGKRTHEIRRLTFARKYLNELELSSQCNFPNTPRSGLESPSPFKLAAEDLYTKMLLLKDDPHHHVWFPKVTPWAKRLFACLFR